MTSRIFLAAALALLSTGARAKHTAYSITDIGSLGALPAYAVGINGAGQVVGCSHEPGWQYCRAFLWQNGSMVDLGTLPTGDSASADAINSSGAIAGTSTLIVNGARVEHAFLWQNGIMQDLGTLPGGSNSNALAIDDAGWVAGDADVPVNGVVETHAFLWQPAAGMQDLGVYPGYSAILGLNAGTVPQLAGLTDVPGQQFTQAGVWTQGATGVFSLQLLPNLPGRIGGEARASNNAGQLVGLSDGTDAAYPPHAALWQKKNGAWAVTDLGVISGFLNSGSLGMNNAVPVQIVGFSMAPANGTPQTTHAFVWQSGNMTDLGTLGGYFSYACSINDSGVIAGNAEAADYMSHAVIWRKQ